MFSSREARLLIERARKNAEMAPFNLIFGAGSRTRTYEGRSREIYSLLSLPLDDSSKLLYYIIYFLERLVFSMYLYYNILDMKDVLKVKNLVKKYHELTAVDGISFNVKEGEILGLLGPNGSGKSTTINCILSLLKFDSGTITIFDKKMTPSAYNLKAQIGVVFQDVAVFDELTVQENIDYFCGLYIADKNTRAKYVEDAINLVGLNDFRKFRPKKLSGGLLRRLNIACGIAHKPKLIFLDEPTVAVDPQSRNSILDNIKKLRDNGATVIYTTHYMEEVEILCDRVIIIDRGKIIASGTPDELKAKSGIKAKRVTIGPTLNDVFLELTGKELRDDVS